MVCDSTLTGYVAVNKITRQKADVEKEGRKVGREVRQYSLKTIAATEER